MHVALVLPLALALALMLAIGYLPAIDGRVAGVLCRVVSCCVASSETINLMILTRRGLAAQHNSISAVQDRCSNVGHLRSSRARHPHHRVKHLWWVTVFVGLMMI